MQFPDGWQGGHSVFVSSDDQAWNIDFSGWLLTNFG
jgi:hypothetical protein